MSALIFVFAAISSDTLMKASALVFGPVFTSAVFSWVFTRRKTKAEIMKIKEEAEAIRADELRKDFNILRGEFNASREEVKELRSEVKALNKRVKESESYGDEWDHWYIVANPDYNKELYPRPQRPTDS